MPKQSNKKGKKPLRPRRGPDGRWTAPSPDPDPPDDQGVVSAPLITMGDDDEIPVTAGGLVIREPAPRPRPTSPPPGPVSPEPETGMDVVMRPRSPSASDAMARPLSKQPENVRRQTRVTIEDVTDEEAPASRRGSPPGNNAILEEIERPSPESEQQDSSWNPAAQSTAQHAFHGDTQFETAISVSPPISPPKSARDSQSVRREMREHAEQAEARAQAAYEQNRAALELISKSMENVKSAFTEARRARERFHDLLSVSSRARQSVRQRAETSTPSAQKAKRDATDQVRGVADYRRRLQSQVLGSDERQAAQPSEVSSWRLRSGMYPASLSRIADGENSSMDLGTHVSTAKFTPQEASRDMDAHRMSVREWVADQRKTPPQRSAPEEPNFTEQRAATPVARAAAESAPPRPNPIIPETPAPRRTAGKRISWLDQLNHPSTSRPFERDPPPHQQRSAPRKTAAGAPEESPSDSSSSSTTTVREPRPPRTPRTPQTPRRQERQSPPSREGSRVPEYLRTRRAPTFEPVTPGGNLTPPRAKTRKGAATAAPAPPPQFGTPLRQRGRTESIELRNEGQNRAVRRENPDKITNMLSVVFISEEQAAARAETVPLHKLGIKSSLPKAYEGQPDQTVFENWLSLLLGFFRIHQLDVLNEVQDRARLEILGQPLKDNAHTFFREHYQKILEQGELWDFREAILDLRDRYLYKNTPFVAARKFETIIQGSRDAQALYDELSTQAARMIEYPSDYHFRIRFMLALRPEVLEYIIKTHSISAEQSTLAQIRSACEDYERSHEYGKQLAATQTRLGGSKISGAQQSSHAVANLRGSSRPQRPTPRVPTTSYNNNTTTTPARPREEGQSKTAPARATPKPDSKTKPAARPTQKTGTYKVSCFICGGPHYAKDCPPEN